LTFDELEDTVVQWHRNRNLIEGSSDMTQIRKLREEVGELELDISHNYMAGQSPERYKIVDLRDELGDCLVVLINIACRNNFSLYEALEYSFGKIKDRKGKMIDGVFVKEEDL
jgi:NTP pyrophosphatase (non-canonical NTP hydrolase)